MKVADILRVKGGTLFTASPEQALGEALNAMAERDIGSLVVMDHGEVVGMLTFREVILAARAETLIESRAEHRRVLRSWLSHRS